MKTIAKLRELEARATATGASFDYDLWENAKRRVHAALLAVAEAARNAREAKRLKGCGPGTSATYYRTLVALDAALNELDEVQL